VESLRNGQWVQTRAISVEVEKQGVEKGTYQHPEPYGQPAERGMNYLAPTEGDVQDRAETERPTPRGLPAATPR